MSDLGFLGLRNGIITEPSTSMDTLDRATAALELLQSGKQPTMDITAIATGEDLPRQQDPRRLHVAVMAIRLYRDGSTTILAETLQPESRVVNIETQADLTLPATITISDRPTSSEETSMPDGQ